MRYLSVIALSMMVVVPAVAPKSAFSQEAEPAAPSAEASPATPDDAPTGASDETGRKPNRKRKAATAHEGASQGPGPRSFFGGPAEDNHYLQTGLSVMPGTGYRLIVPYKDGQFCGDSSGRDNKRVCAHGVPFFLDFQLSFGVAKRADLIVDFRFGLQSDSAAVKNSQGERQFAFAPGLRFWLDQDVTLKFYTTLQFVYDYGNFDGVSNSDYGVRNANGLMYDPIRNVGFYVQFGETIGLARWFRIDLDVGLGVQIRVP
jgi:hypothetical protein